MTAFTYSGSVEISKGDDVRNILVGGTVRAADEFEVETICHLDTFASVEKAFPGYRVTKLPTETNHRLRISAAADNAWSHK